MLSFRLTGTQLRFFSAGANQIKWARLLENLCATAHDGDVRVWDIRVSSILAVTTQRDQASRERFRFQKGTGPVQYISAHLAKVHSLDWHPKNDVQLISSGQDCTLKVGLMLSSGLACGKIFPFPVMGFHEAIEARSPMHFTDARVESEICGEY